MPLWGISTSDESKPKWLSAEEKSNTFATSEGWVYKRPDGTEELLIAVGGLNTALATPTIASVYFANTAATYIQGHTNAHVLVSYNEKVIVAGVPTLSVTGGTTNATASYVSGSNTNQLLFKFTVPSATQTITVEGQTITTNSTVTIVDSANSSVNAVVLFANSAVVGVQSKAGANAAVAVA